MSKREFRKALNELENRVDTAIESLKDLEPEDLPHNYYRELFNAASELKEDINFAIRPENLNDWVDKHEITLLTVRVKQLEENLEQSLA